MNLFFWRRRKISKDLKAVTEVAGDQLAPGVGTFAIVLGGIVVTGLAAYIYHQKKQKGATAQQAGEAGRQRPARIARQSD